MNVLLLTIGSHGDVHPFVGLGMALHQRGHQVTLITNGHFEGLIRSSGLEFAELGTDEEYRRFMTDPDLWHPMRAFRAVFARGIVPLLEQSFNMVAERYVPGRTVLVGSSLALGGRIAQEKLGVPMATIHLAPSVLRTSHDVPKYPGLTMPAWLPRSVKSAFWSLADRVAIDPVIAPPLNRFRATLGLAPVTGIIRSWWNSPERVIGLWPEWFGPIQPDWPAELRLTGFPLYDETGISHVSDELDAWLHGGPPPIAFTFGSAMVQGESYFRESVEACQRLGRRGILLTRFADQVPRDLPETITHIDYAPFGALLPRCAAVVHHGGIGTTAQALRAGTAQLVMPMAHDQLDNGWRVKRLGIGDVIPARRYRASRVATVLRPLLDSPAVRQQCQVVARRFEHVDGLRQTCELIEALGSAHDVAAATSRRTQQR